MATKKVVTIVGGGDSALDWAIILASGITRKVYLVHRRNDFRAAPKTIEKIIQLSRLDNIELITPYQLYQLEGDNGILKKVKVKDLNQNIIQFQSDYLLLFFGMSTNIKPIDNWKLSIKNQHIEVNPATMQTNLHGVFTAGDICDYPGKLRLIITGFGESARACHSAYSYVNPMKHVNFKHSTITGIPKS